MQLVLTRHYVTGDATIGLLTLDEVFQCFTLEDLVRSTKIAGKTAIPAGRYPVVLTESPRFSDKYAKAGRGRLVPLLTGVPNFDGVRIHVGNSAKDTEGCILVGSWTLKQGAAISDSGIAYLALVKKLLAATDPITLTVKDLVAPIGQMLPASVFDALQRVPGLGDSGLRAWA